MAWVPNPQQARRALDRLVDLTSAAEAFAAELKANLDQQVREEGVTIVTRRRFGAALRNARKFLDAPAAR